MGLRTTGPFVCTLLVCPQLQSTLFYSKVQRGSKNGPGSAICVFHLSTSLVACRERAKSTVRAMRRTRGLRAAATAALTFPRLETRANQCTRTRTLLCCTVLYKVL